jgi:hypothetical protein
MLLSDEFKAAHSPEKEDLTEKQAFNQHNSGFNQRVMQVKGSGGLNRTNYSVGGP